MYLLCSIKNIKQKIMESIVKTKWGVDAAHSEIGFKVKHMMISTVKGHFENFDVQVESENDDFKDAKVNDLRHTFVAHHLKNGTSIVLLSKMLGHKRISTTEKYLDYIERETEEEKMELGIL